MEILGENLKLKKVMVIFFIRLFGTQYWDYATVALRKKNIQGF